MTVNIHIERLVLDGLSVPYHQQEQLRAAVEMELGRLFTSNSLPASLMQGGATSDIPAGDIQLQNESNPTGLGQQIALAVFEGVNR